MHVDMCIDMCVCRAGFYVVCLYMPCAHGCVHVFVSIFTYKCHRDSMSLMERLYVQELERIHVESDGQNSNDRHNGRRNSRSYIVWHEGGCLYVHCILLQSQKKADISQAVFSVCLVHAYVHRAYWNRRTCTVD